MKTPDDEIDGPTGFPGAVPSGRVWAVRAGLACLATGLLMFLSTFVVFAASFGNFDHFEERGRTMFLMAIGGMILMIAGMLTAMSAGSGLAGALWNLDPRRARTNLRPWAKLSGQLTDEAFGEMRTVRQTLADLGSNADAPTERIVQVRCRSCRALNDEGARFCNQCGAEL